VRYLGYTDHLGTHFEDNYVCTGFGMHLGLPLLRNGYKENLTLEEGEQLLHQVMKVLYYRDCRCTKHVSLFISWCK
jgi:20S proteasome subunit beta 7